MTFAEATASQSRRDRSYSYSAAHAIDFKSSQDPSPGSDAVDKSSDAPSVTNKSTGATKHQPHPHHHHHHGNSRPRSKSCDLHRHSTTPIHKKKYPHHHYKHIPMVHSPIAGEGHHHGRVSPTSSPSSQPKLKGHLWIRPASSVMGSMSFFPTALASVAPAPTTPVAKDDGVDDDATNASPIRQVTDGSSSSASAHFDKLTELYPSLDSSFESHHRHGHSPTRIVFGANGKPIKPRVAFQHDKDPAEG